MVFHDAISQLILDFGPLGIFIGMFLESSIVPIPSEVVLVAAGAVGFTVFDITIYGGLGSTAGAIVGYYIGRYGGRPVLNKFGKYFFITSDKLKFVDEWFRRWGIYSVMVSRLIPLVPYKVFSITSGIGKMNFLHFVIFTLIGSIPRAFILGYFGSLLYTTGNIVIMVLILGILAAVPLLILRLRKR